MAGLAPLGASPTTTQQVTGTGATLPGSVAPTYTAPPKSAPAPAPANFTAFPSSYAGFGADGSTYGTPGVVDGKLSIVAAPPQVNDAAVIGAGPQTAAGSANAANAGDTAPAASTSQPQPLLQKTGATDQKVANENNTLSAVGNTNTAQQSANSTPQSNPTPPPGEGLLGGSGPPPIPGGTAVENNPALGLLGAPPTNPIVIQADKQEAEAAQATVEANDAAAAQQAAAQAQLQQVDFRIAAARADNNEAAVAQLQPTQTKLTGEIQGQAFAGVGSAPPQTFARPEIPTVFLNIAS
jgi:hypothetical protein